MDLPRASKSNLIIVRCGQSKNFRYIEEENAKSIFERPNIKVKVRRRTIKSYRTERIDDHRQKYSHHY